MWGQAIHLNKQPGQNRDLKKFRNFLNLKLLRDSSSSFDPIMTSPTVRSSDSEEIASASASASASPSRRVRELLALCFSVSFSTSSPLFGVVYLVSGKFF